MKEEYLQKITELRHDLHRHPELSMKEKETSRIIRQFLLQNTGFRIIDRGDWFYAVKEGNGETYPALHTEEYDFNDRILETAEDIFCRLLHPAVIAGKEKKDADANELSLVRRGK